MIFLEGYIMGISNILKKLGLFHLIQRSFYLPPSHAKKLYETVDIRGWGDQIKDLSNGLKPDKITKALQILDISVTSVQTRAYSGYDLTIDKENQQKISEIVNEKPATFEIK